MGLTAGGPRFLLDSGETLVKGTTGRPGAKGRTLAKAQLIASENVRMGLGATAIGASEWSALGRSGVQSLVDAGYPVTAANLVCEEGARPFPAVRVLEDRGRSVAVIGLTEGTVEGCTVTDPATALADATALLAEREVDVVVALWPTRGDAAHHAAIKLLPVDIILDASGRISQPDRLLRAGQSWLLGANAKTKELGVVAIDAGAGEGLFPEGYEKDLDVRTIDFARRLDRVTAATEADDTPLMRRQLANITKQVKLLENEAAQMATASRFTIQRVVLDDAIEGNAAVQARVDAVKASFAAMADAMPSEILTRALVGPAGSVYAGAESCAGCHPAAMEQWRTTPHARAYTALLRDQRHMDDDCYSCHVTGAGSAVTSPETVAGLLHVQCEACHGPSAAHVADPAGTKLVRDPDVSVCTTCHDGERDEGQFDFAAYRPKIVHGTP